MCKENMMNGSQRSVALSICLSLVAVAVSRLLAAAGPADNATPLKLLKTIPLGGDGRWDYLCVDAEARKLYLPRTTHVQVVDLDKGTVVGDIPKISAKGAHGVALVPDRNMGFISAGRDNGVVAFDMTTLKVGATIKTGANPDAILYDPASKHVLSMNHTGGDITVIDPAALDKTVTIPVGGTLEYAVADGAGHVFVCVEDKNEVVQVDTKANTVLARWSLAPGDAPTGLDIDVKNHRLFAGCGNQKMIVLDSKTGKVLGAPSIGKGVDGVAYEPTLGVALSANGKDGTVSVIKETTPGHFETIQTVKTLVGAKTIAVDAKTRHALLPCLVPTDKGAQTFGIAVVGVDAAK
jgi:DNA-binding beta-propeller fold protein YncE